MGAEVLHALRGPWRLAVLGAGVAVLAGCGGGREGAAVEARAQVITFDTVPALELGEPAAIAASASSGLPVALAVATPAVCGMDAVTGMLTATAPGTCVVIANQGGNDTWAPAPPLTRDLTVLYDPNQAITFAAAPPLTLGGTATVSATASSGLPVAYTSATPATCAVEPATGLVTGLAGGACAIQANQPGDAWYAAAPTATLDLVVEVPVVITAPGAPTDVAARLGATAGTVEITAGATDSGGSPITSYTAVSHPAGLATTAATLPLVVDCGGPCAGYAFSVTATNAVGEGPSSAPVHVVTGLAITTTFREPDTQPRDTIFTGTFTLDSTAGTVAGLAGSLTQSMTGDPLGAPPGYGMSSVPLAHQLATLDDGAGNLLVGSFLLATTDTLSTIGGGDGWFPGTGFGLYYGFPAATNPADGGVGNAYMLVNVDPVDPFAPLSQARVDSLAYADCTAAGMMGAACMTGTTVAGYGSIGTMSGYPVSQAITRR